MQKTIERDTRSIAHGKEKMVLVFIFLLLSLFSLVRFPLGKKAKERTMQVKGTRFLFPFGNNGKNRRRDTARGGIC